MYLYDVAYTVGLAWRETLFEEFRRRKEADPTAGQMPLNQLAGDIVLPGRSGTTHAGTNHKHFKPRPVIPKKNDWR
jgi:hypothetical protein